MMGQTHVILGVTAGSLCAAAVSPWVHPGAALLCIPVGALMGPAADIDHASAPAHRVMVAGIVIGLLALVLWDHRVLWGYGVALVVYGVSQLLPETRVEAAWRGFWRHREGTHRIRTALGVGAVVAAATWFLGGPWVSANGWAIGAAVTAGWLSHIYGDARTLSGIPVGDSIVNIGRPVRTGSTYRSAEKKGEDPRRTEEHLYRRRFRPAAVVSTIAALLVITGAVPAIQAVVAAGIARLS